MNNKRWSLEEINFLKLNYNNLSVKEISIEINKSYNAVISKAFSLKLCRVNLNNKSNKTTRFCTVCKKEFPKTKDFFTTFVSTRDGEVFQTKCKKCEKTYIQERNSTPEHSFKGILKKIISDDKRIKKGFDLDLSFLLELWKKQNHKCVISGIEMTTLKGKGVYYFSNVSVDKIIPELGYIKTNVQLVCSWANTAKSNLSVDDFENMISLTYNNINK